MTDLATMPGTHPYASLAPVFTVDDTRRGEFARDLVRLDVAEGVMGLRTMVLHLLAVGPSGDGSADSLSYVDGDLVRLGSVIDVNIGPPGAERWVFHGVVSAVEAVFSEGQAPMVALYAEDALMRLKISQRTARYENMTDEAIVREVASSHGLAFEGHGLTGPTNPLVQQWEQSDLGFVRDRAARLNAEVWADGDDKIHLAAPTERRSAEVTLVQGNELIGAELRVDLAHQRSEIGYRGWDDVAVAAVDERAGADVVRAEVSGEGRTGPEVVAEVFPESKLFRSRRDALTGETARDYARAEMQRRSRAFVTVEGITNGTPDLMPGTHLELQRVGTPFEGPGYRCTFAQHSYDTTTGYRTRFRAERAVLS